MAKRHYKTKWCSKGGFLCKMPEHWRWTEGYSWDDEYASVAILRRYDRNEEKAFGLLMEEAMTGQVVAVKMLGVLAFNNPEYEQWKPTVLALYKSIIGKE